MKKWDKNKLYLHRFWTLVRNLNQISSMKCITLMSQTISKNNQSRTIQWPALFTKYKMKTWAVQSTTEMTLIQIQTLGISNPSNINCPSLTSILSMMMLKAIKLLIRTYIVTTLNSISTAASPVLQSHLIRKWLQASHKYLKKWTSVHKNQSRREYNLNLECIDSRTINHIRTMTY